MYGRKPIKDASRAARAILSNLLASYAPAFYVRLTGQTGRGSAPESAQDIANYFRRCFDDYCEQLGLNLEQAQNWLRGQCLLEYGPGDVPGVALLMLAYGADKVICVDRFPLAQSTPKQIEVLEQLVEGLVGEAKQRVATCFYVAGDPRSGLRRDRLEYVIKPSGLSGLREAVDCIYSRAVLEHVNDLEATFKDIAKALKPGGITIHQVDLKSHGLHRENSLDFLTWPTWLWDLMYSGKGVPNRWRIDCYRRAIDTSGLKLQLLEPTLRAQPEDIAEVRPYLARAFKELPDEDLSWLGFWLVAHKPASAQID